VVTPQSSTPELENAVQYLAARKYREAELLLIEYLRREPNRIEAYHLLADAELALGDFAKATLVLQSGVSLAPDDAPIAARVGELFALRGRWKQAIAAYKHAIECGMLDAETMARLAMSQIGGYKIEDASQTTQCLSQRFPDSHQAPLINALLKKSLGLFNEAAASYERALELAPDSSVAWHGLVELSPPAPCDNRTLRLAALCNHASLDSDRANFEFSLARIHDRAGHFDDAFKHYCEANKATKRSLDRFGLQYLPIETERGTDANIARYPRSLFSDSAAAMPSSIRPIFIIGLPRSGTTLVEQILSSHPQVSAGGELTAIPIALEDFLQRRRENGLRGEIDPTNPLDASLLSEMRERYLESLFEHDLGTEVVTDKFPGNFENVGFIRLLFPKAIIVHCRRVPIATCWSLYSTNLAVRAPYYTSLDHLAHFYGEYKKMMAHWKSLPTPPLIDVSYERLVKEPEEGIRQLLEACGLKWDDRCLAFHENPRAVTTASVIQVRQPLYISSLEHWRCYSGYLGTLRNLTDD